jgi:tetraacyldisaccharide 4'-kinase
MGSPLSGRVRERAGQLLEAGVQPTAIGRAASAIWEVAAARGVRREVDIPQGLRVVGIGGAVLGGAGKTPVAIALARELARRGERVALVSHAYRAEPGRAREVCGADHPREVGDDALAAARSLERDGVPVIVAPSRSGALERARARGAEVVIVDGLLQARPRPLTDAVLVLDALAPWGSGRCPPLGDLRATRESLLAAADHVALVTPSAAPPPILECGIPEGAARIPSVIAGASRPCGERLDVPSIRALRAGLVLGIARPERIVAALARDDIEPGVILSLGDHADLAPADLERAMAAWRAAARRGLSEGPRPDVWLTTAKCATKLPQDLWGAPVYALDHCVDIAALAGRLRAIKG